MDKKIFLIGLGAVLLMAGFFAGMKYKETPKDNVKSDTLKMVKTEPVLIPENIKSDIVDVVKEGFIPDLDSFPIPTDLYLAGESRTISVLKNFKARIALGFVYEVKTIMDKENHLLYQIYRIGQGEFGKGRIFLQILDSTNPPTYLWSMYDTQIDALELEPLGKVYIRGGKLIITCSVKDFFSKNFCEYQIDYSKKNQSLRITRNI